MKQASLFIAAIGGFTGVALGAFGAHGLKNSLAPAQLAVFQTGVQYQLLHSLALLGLAVLLRQHDSSLFRWTGRCFVVGTVLFSGSLYLLALSGIRPLGMITPLGGVALLAGWFCLALGAWREGHAPAA
ncbi:DUF423 domain-containing protein [Chitinimonas arctica]|uniref:DUF423 domain-containing protein n=1 Tax=Chitinimonas arctica TaxID=2594795 RepID=A0A516SEW1_9NEIS|nr:DUF423 domain-containing protein [Chitinimonas arctica]QDQ26568.1 DUF423 domain-containing protein [Chitinimonas arctica]